MRGGFLKGVVDSVCVIIRDVIPDQTAQVKVNKDDQVIENFSATAPDPTPGHNGFWFDDNQDVAPRRPKPAEQDPKYSILDSQARVRMFSLEDAQLLTEGKDLEAEVVAGTGEYAEAGEQADEKWNHEFGFIA